VQTEEVDFAGRLPIEGYGPGFFRVGGVLHEGPLLLLPGGATPWGGFPDLAAVTAAADTIDVLLVGTGAELSLLPGDVQAHLDAIGVMAEAMATPSACRSYNVLLAEGRQSGAALIPV
jgi:uncharacterized protein